MGNTAMYSVKAIKSLLLAGVIGLAGLLAGCGGGGAGGTSNVSTASTTLVVTPASGAGNSGTVLTFVVTGGRAPYAVFSANQTIATVSTVTQSSGHNLFTATLGQAGSTEIMVTDSSGQLVSVSLSSTGLAVTPGSGVGVRGDSLAFSVGGGTAPYTVISNNTAVASATISGNTVTAVLGATGTTSLIVRDAGNNTIPISITVAQTGSVAAAPTSGSGVIGNVLTFSVAGGSGTYSVISNNPAVATATVSGNTVIATLGATGSTVLVVRDAGGNTAQISITVVAASAPTVAPASGAGNIGGTLQFTISGGASPYTVQSNNAAITTATIVGGNLTANLLASGTTTLLVRDNNGLSTSVTMSVAAPSAISISPGDGAGNVGDTLTFTVAGGVPPYTATSSNTALATVSSIPANTLTARLLAVGTPTITVTDSLKVSNTINITSTALAAGPIAVAPESGSGAAGATLIFQIGGGKAPYTVISHQPTTATATISANQMTVSLLQAGTTTLVVSDSLGNTANVGLTVAGTASLTVSPNVSSVAVGSSFNMMVSGGRPPYSVLSTDPSIGTVAPASVPTSGGYFTFTPVKAGSADLVVRDATGSLALPTITVTQPGGTLLTAVPTAVTWTASACGAVFNDFVVYGGTPPYTAQSSSLLIATVSSEQIDVSGNRYFRVSKPCSTALETAATGEAVITIRDSVGATISPAPTFTFTIP